MIFCYLQSIVSQQSGLCLYASPCQIRLAAFSGAFAFLLPSMSSIHTYSCCWEISRCHGRHPLTEWLREEFPGGFVSFVMQAFLCFQPVIKNVVESL